MNIVILGSEGFVGQNLVEGLEKNHNIISADQLEQTNHFNYRKFDITNFDSVVNTINDADIVIDLVADSLVSSIDGSIKNAEVNIIGLLNVLEACRKKNIKKIIFTSASSLIGHPETFKVSEKQKPLPKTAYGITKLASEHYLRLYKELYDINYVIFRFFNIYGPYQKNGLIPTFYNKIIKNESLTVFGKGNQIRDYVYIKDIVEFFDKAISSSISDNLVLNMGTGEGTSIKQIIEFLSKITKIKPKINLKPERLGEIGDFVADTSLLNSVFNTIPKTKVEDGLNNTVSWLNQHTH